MAFNPCTDAVRNKSCMFGIKRIMLPAWIISSITARRRLESVSSGALAISVPISSETNRLSNNGSGTWSLMMRNARRATIVDFPEPGSPTRSAFGFPGRERICTIWSNSRSCPMRRPTFSARARSVRSVDKRSRSGVGRAVHARSITRCRKNRGRCANAPRVAGRRRRPPIARCHLPKIITSCMSETDTLNFSKSATREGSGTAVRAAKILRGSR